MNLADFFIHFLFFNNFFYYIHFLSTPLFKYLLKIIGDKITFITLVNDMFIHAPSNPKYSFFDKIRAVGILKNINTTVVIISSPVQRNIAVSYPNFILVSKYAP